MERAQYKAFSLRIHNKNRRIKKPNACELELTFGCGLHCRHCYTECYNRPAYLRKELDTQEVKSILDKVYQAGVIWLTFTGGDPLNRADFLEIYSYARNKGFIISLFTNGYSMTEEIAAYLKEKPPFALEMTLNAATKDLYEMISQTKGSFDKVVLGIDLILGKKLPLKIKTQINKDNLKELPQIKKFIRGLGLRFRPDAFINARLDGDLAPCDLRISPQDVLNLEGGQLLKDVKCRISSAKRNKLFSCTIGNGDGIRIDPYGNLVPCICIREPRVNLVKKEIKQAQKEILTWVRTREFTGDTKCSTCSIKELCRSCPGMAWLERRNLEEKVDWFCELTHLSEFASRKQ